jgi:hypothetical protein
MRVKVAHDQLSLGTFNKETSVAIGNQVFLAKKFLMPGTICIYRRQKIASNN